MTSLPEPDPSLSYLTPEPALKGQTLFLGGELGSDDRIWCIPGHASRVMVIDPTTDQCVQIGPEYQGKFKWLRGIQACNGVVYGLQCHSPEVLRIDATALEKVHGRDKEADPDLADYLDKHVKISTIPVPYDTFFEDPEEAKKEKDMIWKYHGGAISPVDNCIYCIPQSATRVLRIDPVKDKCEFVGPKLEGKYKWYGGLAAKDGCVYGIPHNSGSVLRIWPKVIGDNIEVEVTLHGDFGENSHQWHGAGMCSDGNIVCIPNNVSKVLMIRPAEKGHEEVGPKLEIIGDEDVVGTGDNAGRRDRKYKYLGAMSDKNGNVYCIPSGTERVLRVNTRTNVVDEIGPSLYTSGMERLKQNKWQNGFYSDVDSSMYAIPLAAETVLKVELTTQSHDSDDEIVPVVKTLGLPFDPNSNLAKWEGGTKAPNGNMYCMPNNFKKVLKIEPTRV